MQTFSPPETRSRRDALRRLILSVARRLPVFCFAFTLVALHRTTPAKAQTLARPGWAGSGLATETWWRNAVFYRIAVPSFQDSDGDGIGDLPGVIERLDYLQSLGIDAVLLGPPEDDTAFGNLLREASSRHIRIVIELDAATANLVSQARLWLTRGAAGVSIAGTFHNSAEEAQAHLPELRTLIRSFPGERVLIVRPDSTGSITQASTAQLVAQSVDLNPAQPPHLSLPVGSIPLLETPDTGVVPPTAAPAQTPGLDAVVAARLLTLPGAAALRSGQELGASQQQPASFAVMPWTPSNITPPPAQPREPEPAAPAAPSDPSVYTAFKPYVAPKPAPKPLPPGTVAAVDPNSLPGFTSGTLRQAPRADAATINVAVEEADPRSLLHFYRRLIALHHGNASLRSGTLYNLNHDAEQASVWLRRAPANARTAATVIVTCNLSDQPITLSLDADLDRLHLRAGILRPLAGSWTATPFAQYTRHIVLPPHSVYIGELHH